MIDLMLPILVLLPFTAGIGLLLARRCGMADSIGERIGIATAVVTLVISLFAMLVVGDAAKLAQADMVIAPRIEFAPAWMVMRLPSMLAANSQGWQLSLGLDGIGLAMVLLTTLVTTAVLIVAHSTVARERSDFAAWTLMATGGLLLVFTAMDLVLFYVGFEITLIPLFALIAMWGDKDADIAAKRFVLYTLAGSIPMILGLLGIAQLYAIDGVWTISLPKLSGRAAAAASHWELMPNQIWVFVFLVLGLGIKMALLPFHTWLPKTYGACHPTCGAFLAAVVLKLGLFGFVRLAIPMLPMVCEQYGPLVMGVLGAIAIVVGALMALAQSDLRKLLAYSSLSHVGFVTVGLFALNEEGISGAVLQMFNHGITTAAIFLVAACVIARRGTAMLDSGSHGLARRYPKLAAFMIFFLAAGAGVPGLNNFVGETLTLSAMVARQPVVAAIGLLGIVLGAWYAFRLIQNLLFGQDDLDRRHQEGRFANASDVGVRENSVFALLATLCLVIGVYPQPAIDIFRRDTSRISQVCDIASSRHLTITSTQPNP